HSVPPGTPDSTCRRRAPARGSIIGLTSDVPPSPTAIPPPDQAACALRTDLGQTSTREYGLSEPDSQSTGAEMPAPSAAPSSAPATLVVNTGVMVAARVYLLVAGGALSIYAIRTFSTESYGRYAIAGALIMIFGLLSEMGITTIALREMAMDSGRSREILAVALWSEFITSVLAA